jgi:phosphopantothenoylcysteine synthetase/decarboxylase
MLELTKKKRILKASENQENLAGANSQSPIRNSMNSGIKNHQSSKSLTRRDTDRVVGALGLSTDYNRVARYTENKKGKNSGRDRSTSGGEEDEDDDDFITEELYRRALEDRRRMEEAERTTAELHQTSEM